MISVGTSPKTIAPRKPLPIGSASVSHAVAGKLYCNFKAGESCPDIAKQHKIKFSIKKSFFMVIIIFAKIMERA
jgi:hypothetical protein